MVKETKKETDLKKEEGTQNTSDKDISKDTEAKVIQDPFKKQENQSRGRKPFRRDSRKPRMEFDQKIIGIRRVTRVVAGGRRFSFSVSIVIGNRKGSVGVGMGKASDTALAIEKAYNNAKKLMIKPPLTNEMTVPHSIKTKFASSEIFIKPAPGKGLIAGSSVRTVLELAGVTDVNAKIFSRSKNSFNNAKATIKALSLLVPKEKVDLKKKGK